MKELPRPNNLESELLRSIGSPSIKELSTDVVEAILDQATGDGLLKDIPILGSLAKLQATFGTVRDLIFTKKVAHFLSSLSKTPDEDRSRFLTSIARRGCTHYKTLGDKSCPMCAALTEYSSNCALRLEHDAMNKT